MHLRDDDVWTNIANVEDWTHWSSLAETAFVILPGRTVMFLNTLTYPVGGDAYSLLVYEVPEDFYDHSSIPEFTLMTPVMRGDRQVGTNVVYNFGELRVDNWYWEYSTAMLDFSTLMMLGGQERLLPSAQHTAFWEQI
jgi:hypothetical protein